MDSPQERGRPVCQPLESPGFQRVTKMVVRNVGYLFRSLFGPCRDNDKAQAAGRTAGGQPTPAGGEHETRDYNVPWYDAPGDSVCWKVPVVIHGYLAHCHNGGLAVGRPEPGGREVLDLDKALSFHEDNFRKPCDRRDLLYSLNLLFRPREALGLGSGQTTVEMPTLAAIFNFINKICCDLELSAESYVVTLIFATRAMTIGRVPMLATTWKPLLLCSLMLAAQVEVLSDDWVKVFAEVVPEFTLSQIINMEQMFILAIDGQAEVTVDEIEFRQRQLMSIEDVQTGDPECGAQGAGRPRLERREPVLPASSSE